LSHIVQIEAKLHDPTAVAAACQRLGLPAPVQGTAELYSGSAMGLLVSLPGWEYPAVVDTLTGTVRYDNYGGAWGKDEELGRFMQSYLVEKAKIEAQRKNFPTRELTLEDGSIRLEILEGA
jgi:hypothetical protein